MKCFHFLNREKNDEPRTQKSTSVRSTSTSMSIDHDLKRSGSEFNSQNVSDISTESSAGNSLAFLSQRHSNLREFSYSELKAATKNFSRSAMLGEGGFGGVYKGVTRSTEDSRKKIDIAVKQLSRRGLQVYKEIGLTRILFLLYRSGATHFDQLAKIMTGYEIGGVQSSGIFMGILFIVVGFPFNITAVPFHMWAPYIYEGSPTPITTFLSIAPKIAIFVNILRRFIYGSYGATLQLIFFFCSIASMILGALAAMAHAKGHKEWVTEVNVLGIAEHPNLVKLVGYCAEDDERGIQRLLVYEYMPNRSVQDHLINRLQTPLSWATRMKIAQDAARGLAYLHEGMDIQIIFRDFKSSNILLDAQWNAKLSDFGLARLGPSDGLSHVSTAVVGTIGYAAPEYIQTGRLTAKNDVWSYGVFLYELITGRRPVDRNRPKKEQNLIEWVRPHLTHVKKFELIMDPRLEGKYSLKCAMKLANVANRCLARQPKMRPKISEILEMVNQIMEAAELGSPHVAIKSEELKEGCEKPRNRLKRRLVDTLIGEEGWLIWRTWKPKNIIVKLC